jgi:hypothetical protein
MIDGAAINVLDYGAVGDGVNDDTSAFIAAIAALTAGTSTEVLYIPALNYKLTATLALPTYTKNITVYAYGALLNFNTLGVNANAIQTNGIVNTNSQTFRWFGGIIAGPDGTTGTGSGVFLYPNDAVSYMWNTTLRDVVVQGFGIGLQIYSLANSQIEDCTFFANGKNIDIQTIAGGVDSISFINCMIRNSQVSYGVDIHSGTGNQFRNCRFIGNAAYGLAINPNTVYAYIADLLIDGCYFEGNTTGAIRQLGSVGIANESKNTTIRNSVFVSGENIVYEVGADHWNVCFAHNWLNNANFSGGSNLINPLIYGNKFDLGGTLTSTATYNANDYLPPQDGFVVFNSYARYAKIGVALTTYLTSDANSPEGVYTAPIGCLYTRTNGGAGTTLYVKESGTGNTGWVAK